MMRNKPQSSMQKTYDDCYLICSTAVYFEGQDNEAEALRSWRSALDQIYYHNAYRVPPNYRPKSETEKALQVSLRSMELRCKERVDLLEALKRSRIEGKEDGDKIDGSPSYRKPSISSTPNFGTEKEHAGSSAQGTVPIVKYPELSRPGPPLPERPVPVQTKSSPSYIQRSPNLPQIEVTDGRSFPSPALPLPSNQISRTSSPEKRSRMRTTLRTTTEGKKSSKPKEKSEKRPPAASKAAGLAWDSISRSSGKHLGQSLSNQAGSTPNIDSAGRNSRGDISISRRQSEDITRRTSAAEQSQSSEACEPAQTPSGPRSPHEQLTDRKRHEILRTSSARPSYANESSMLEASSRQEMKEFSTLLDASRLSDQYQKPEADFLSYRNEYLAPSLASQASAAAHFTKPTAYHDPPLPPSPSRQELSSQRKTRVAPPPPISRRPVANVSSPRVCKHGKHPERPPTSSESTDEHTSSGREAGINARMPRKKKPATINATTPPSSEESVEGSLASHIWEERVAYIKKNLPKGVDENAAKQIFNDIVVKGDEVHWEDVAGLDAAKSALKEAVVYPFLRPDLFMGLREPARGMLLFGPPGTGKTMLARAVATESRSTFFAISASSLTSKWLGESEKLVRALFQLAKALAPSIIFVDEIDSLLSSRGGSSEHESTRRVKTEFLIQWSDLQRAAAGKEQTDKQKKDGDATRVLVLAATNMPWAIDEAARRRFVRRQYIPLPEGHVRAEQLMTLMSHQKHDLSQEDIQVLVELTDGFSGSDITALAKDAAMGPLRSLGEALLHMSMEDIRPIRIADFEASLVNIRPSVSKQGLKEFEDWAKEFGERGG